MLDVGACWCNFQPHIYVFEKKKVLVEGEIWKLEKHRYVWMCVCCCHSSKKSGTILSLQSPDWWKLLNNDNHIPWGILWDNKMVVLYHGSGDVMWTPGIHFYADINFLLFNFLPLSFIHSQSIRISFSQLVGRRFSRSVSQIVHTTVSLWFSGKTASHERIELKISLWCAAWFIILFIFWKIWNINWFFSCELVFRL